MYKTKDFTELRVWTVERGVEIKIGEIKERFEELIKAIDAPVVAFDIEIDGHIPAINLACSANSNYMGIYVYYVDNYVGMAVEGKGEQIKAPELEKLFYRAAGSVLGIYNSYKAGKNIASQYGMNGLAGGLGAVTKQSPKLNT